MININFGYSATEIEVELQQYNISNVIFYIIDRDNKSKIFIKYLDGKKIVFDKSLIEHKNVIFQFYYIDNSTGIKKSVVSNLIVYRNKDIKKYSLILGKDNYNELKSQGYFSVDKKHKINLNKINWETGHRNFDFNINALRFLSSYWARFYKTFELSVLKDIFSILEQYSDYMKGQEKGKSLFINYDMAIGIRSLHISCMLEFRDLLKEEEKNTLNWLKNEHLKMASNPKIFSLNNHGLWLMYGLRLLLRSDNDKDKDTLNYCFNQFDNLVNSSFNDEYMGTENSPFYHQYNIDIYKRIPSTLFPHCNKLKGILNNAPLITPWLTDSKGNYYLIGDTEGKSRYRFSPQKKQVTIDSSDSLIFWKSYELSGFFISKIYTKEYKILSEVVFYNTSDSYVHKHLDGNAFICFYRGREIFTDAGKYSYDYTEARRYFTSMVGHNTVFLENIIPSVKDLNLKESGFKEIKEYKDRMEIKSRVIYTDIFTHDRCFVLLSNGDIRIKDSIMSKLENNLVLNFLLGKNVVPEIENDSIRLKIDGKLVCNMHLKSGAIIKKIFHGNVDPYRGWISEEYNVKIPTYSIEIVYPSSVKNIETLICFN